MQSIAQPRGFTLIELCVLLALLAVLSSFAVPSLSATLARARTAAVLNRLSGDLFLARALASRSGDSVVLRFQPAGGCAEVYEIVAADARVLKRVTLSVEATGVCLTSNVARAMRVNSRGMLVGSPRTLFASSGRVTDTATVSMVGRVYRSP